MVSAPAPAGALRALLRPVMPPDEYTKYRREIDAWIDANLKEGTHYGRINGGKKKPLWKPGAEKICEGFGLLPKFEELAAESDPDRVITFESDSWEERPKPDEETVETMQLEGTGRFRNIAADRSAKPNWIWLERTKKTGTSLGFYRLKLKCYVTLPDGTVVGEGIGSCSTVEAEYIEQPRQHENTISKMAYKRSHVDAVLRGLALSDRFTQDEELIEARSPDALVVAAASTPAPAATTTTPTPPPPRPATTETQESKLALIATINHHFEALGFDEGALRDAEAEKILGRRFRSHEDLVRLERELEVRVAAARPPTKGEEWAFLLLDEIDTCVDGDQLDRVIRGARAELDAIALEDSQLAAALEAYSLRAGSRFAGSTLHLEPDEKALIDWLVAFRKARREM